MKQLPPGIILFLMLLVIPISGAQAEWFPLPLVNSDRTKLYGDPLQAALPPWTAPKTYQAEHYIGSTLRHGLDLVLPQPIRKNLDVDAGYDKWYGLPTLTADFFLPVRAWNDKSIFVSPRWYMTGTREELSLGAGMRHLINPDVLVGFHAFHDWVRPRGSAVEFLKEVGVGIELAALPGNFSDLTISANAYFPVNERWTSVGTRAALIREALPRGMDVKLGFLLPALIDALDIRFNAQTHSYRGEQTNLTGYRWGLSFNTRDGMLSGLFERGREEIRGDHFRVEANVTLAFDLSDLLDGKMPFSPPYHRASDRRFSRKLHEDLCGRVVRKHDLPTDKDEKKITLATATHAETVRVSGGFPGLGNAVLTVQTASSPWRDRTELVTNPEGAYSGRLQLPPGTYRIRLVHKRTGLVTEEQTITINEQ
jgi:hypothetical protein